MSSMALLSSKLSVRETKKMCILRNEGNIIQTDSQLAYVYFEDLIEYRILEMHNFSEKFWKFTLGFGKNRGFRKLFCCRLFPVTLIKKGFRNQIILQITEQFVFYL